MPHTPSRTHQRSSSQRVDKTPLKSLDPTVHPPAPGLMYDLSLPQPRLHATGHSTVPGLRDHISSVDGATVSQSAPNSWLIEAASSYVLYDEPASNLSPSNPRGSSPRPRSPMPDGSSQHHSPHSRSTHHSSRGLTSDLKTMARAQSMPRPRSPYVPGGSPTVRHQTQSHLPSSSMHPSHSPSSRRLGNYSGNMSDSSVHGFHLDMKRLLSKPAAPSHSGSSIISLPSDSEATPPSPNHTKTPISAPEKELSLVSENRDNSRAKEAILKASSPLGQPQLTRRREPSMPRPGSSRETDNPTQSSEGLLSGLPRKESRGRSLRMISSPSSNSPTTPTPTVVVPSPRTTSAAASRRPVVPSLMIDSTYGTRPGTSPADRSIGRAAGRRFYGASTATKHREMNTSAPSTPISLTPAGAVAHAYKQQEQHREKLASMMTADDGSAPEHRHPKSRSLDNARNTEFTRNSQEVSPTPYYTVFGSGSGKVVAVGGPDDHDWIYTTAVYAERSESRVGRASSASVKRTLSRKVSTTWKKGKSTTREEETSDAGDHSLSTEGDLATVQARRSASLPKERRKSLHLSIDDFAERRVVDPLRTGRSLPASRHGTMRPNWGDDFAGSSSDHVQVVSRKLVKPKDLRKKEDSPTGGKLWKLMKRISTGGLREKYASQDFSPPPVPALPKEYAAQSPARSVEAIESPGRVVGGGLAGFIQSRPSMATSRSPFPPSPSGPEASSRASIAGFRRGSNATSGNRPSTTTRSSSPVSSDRLSSKFFHRTHSTRSSMSSYGEELPPLPSGKVAQHIIPPSELYKLNNEAESPKANMNQQDMYKPMFIDEVPASLPCPPRRLGSSGKGSSSPMVPPLASFEPLSAMTLSHLSPLSSSDGDTSTWTSPITPASGRPLSDFGVQPPPRPPRSSQRPLAVNSTFTSPLSGTMGPSSSIPTFSFTPTDERANPLDSYSDRDTQLSYDRNSYGTVSNASTTKGHRRSSSLGSSQTDTPSQSGVMFREFGARLKTQWSDKEKAEKWDDLLARSARAGGTLHIGGEGLMSDNIRFSKYSDSDS